MKHILILISFVSLSMSATSFASTVSQDQLKDRIKLMMSSARTEKNTAVRKMIVSGAISALANSNIKDAELKDMINDEVYSISDILTKRERASINRDLAKLK